MMEDEIVELVNDLEEKGLSREDALKLATIKIQVKVLSDFAKENFK